MEVVIIRLLLRLLIVRHLRVIPATGTVRLLVRFGHVGPATVAAIGSGGQDSLNKTVGLLLLLRRLCCRFTSAFLVHVIQQDITEVHRPMFKGEPHQVITVIGRSRRGWGGARRSGCRRRSRGFRSLLPLSRRHGGITIFPTGLVLRGRRNAVIRLHYCFFFQEDSLRGQHYFIKYAGHTLHSFLPDKQQKKSPFFEKKGKGSSRHLRGFLFGNRKAIHTYIWYTHTMGQDER